MNYDGRLSAFEGLHSSLLTFIVSKREDMVFSCLPLPGVLDPDMIFSWSLRRMRRSDFEEI